MCILYEMHRNAIALTVTLVLTSIGELGSKYGVKITEFI
jgi:hypothetical protein